jgi:hypothetical protein
MHGEPSPTDSRFRDKRLVSKKTFQWSVIQHSSSYAPSLKGRRRCTNSCSRWGRIQASRKQKSQSYTAHRESWHTSEACHVNHEAGLTFALCMGHDGKFWNFLQASDRARARKLISQEKPFIVIGSPPCTDFSSWNMRSNHKRMSEEEVRRRKAEEQAETLLGFAIEVHERQMCHGHHGRAAQEERRRRGRRPLVPVRPHDASGQ